MNLNKLTANIQSWAIERGLDEAEPEKQLNKLIEEIGELAQGINKGNLNKIKDGIGDGFVVLTVLSMQLDLSIQECIEYAYNEIKDRKGKMINGVFVKESDLNV
ncbi:MazG-like family protein [Virgibacillus salexigens]|uniref:MazG-like family protein n=1 Tax=Virgibacillus salexigens TaxID=61016 RepID=UPI003081330E